MKNLTPYANLTDSELLREAMNLQEPSDMEAEMMLRLESLLYERDDLLDLPESGSLL